MGVKSIISLEEVKRLFGDFECSSLTPTTDGVIDTTYLLDGYILKRYERDIQEKIEYDINLLKRLKESNLNVSLALSQSDGWYLYERLEGESPKNIKLFHIQSLARFMAKLHSKTYKQDCGSHFLESYDLDAILSFTKERYFVYFKSLESIKGYKMRSDGFIHGDVFRDNTLFHGSKIALFDFIDGGCGAFVFDIAVALMAFNPNKRYAHTKLFLKTYNQKAPKKIAEKELIESMRVAAKLYALLRIDNYKNITKAKELANFW